MDRRWHRERRVYGSQCELANCSVEACDATLTQQKRITETSCLGQISGILKKGIWCRKRHLFGSSDGSLTMIGRIRDVVAEVNQMTDRIRLCRGKSEKEGLRNGLIASFDHAPLQNPWQLGL